MTNIFNRLAVGTAQFGMRYGVANRNGAIPATEVSKILNLCKSAGVTYLDTASGYGDSEKKLGEYGVQNFNLITKISKSKTKDPNWIRSEVEKSLIRLNLTCIYGVLFHDLADVLNDLGCYPQLVQMKNQGIVQKIGVSLYDAKDYRKLKLNHIKPDIIQVPFNVFDRRLLSDGLAAEMQDDGVEIHARSIFLQGLLLMHQEKIPDKFFNWREEFNSWNRFVSKTDLTLLEACIGFVLNHDFISKIILGVDNIDQITEIISKFRTNFLHYPSDLEVNDLRLINPVNWCKL